MCLFFCFCFVFFFFFFFKQKTAYEMRISDWSSDVCSSDLIEPHVVEYLKTPPSRALLERLIERAGITPRELLREKGTPYAELGLGNPDLTDGALIDAMMAHPVLINRPLVVTSLGVKLCRPSE